MGALVAEPLYLLADTAVVGHLGTLSLGGLAVASAALLLIYGLCFFLAYGTTATVARFTGAGEPLKAANQAIQSLWLAFFLGLGIAIISTPKGVMTDVDARKQKIGGEIICKVF